MLVPAERNAPSSSELSRKTAPISVPFLREGTNIYTVANNDKLSLQTRLRSPRFQGRTPT